MATCPSKKSRLSMPIRSSLNSSSHFPLGPAHSSLFPFPLHYSLSPTPPPPPFLFFHISLYFLPSFSQDLAPLLYFTSPYSLHFFLAVARTCLMLHELSHACIPCFLLTIIFDVFHVWVTLLGYFGSFRPSCGSLYTKEPSNRRPEGVRFCWNSRALLQADKVKDRRLPNSLHTDSDANHAL